MNLPAERFRPYTVPAYVVEYFLLGKTRADALERYTQNGGIVADVWMAFAKDLSQPQRVLVSPRGSTTAVELGARLHESIYAYRADNAPEREEMPLGVSPLENFVAVTLFFDELIRVVLPLTPWWHTRNLASLRREKVNIDKIEGMLYRAILLRLGLRDDDEVLLRKEAADPTEGAADPRLLEAAPIAALIGVFMATFERPDMFSTLERPASGNAEDQNRFLEWIRAHAELIAGKARAELQRHYAGTGPIESQELVQRVFLDRAATLAQNDALCTIKADAAFRVFDVSCRNVTWAIIDCGIAGLHPAFLDHDARDRRGNPVEPKRSRVRATYDFTLIERIRNFDLTLHAPGSARNVKLIADIVEELAQLPGRVATGEWRERAAANLQAIARDLKNRIPPDWALIQPLIQIEHLDDGRGLVSDHGTHVAGILGADWRDEDPQREPILLGVCPDIALYDLRVIHARSRRSSEFALLAALEFVEFVNRRAGASTPVIHGVNISLSIPHDVRNYGCGATPVCVAADHLVGSGVVVVAAAGNRGWSEQEAGFGNFVFCSITDPGNAHEVITVGATHRQRPHTYGVSYFSSRGPTGDGRVKPDLVAPGEQIRGPVRGDTEEELDGTSMAAPFVSGAAAMLLARHRELVGDPSRVKEILLKSATDLGRERYFQGHGLVDVLRALQSL
jgi:subtilisin family serine protease